MPRHQQTSRRFVIALVLGSFLIAFTFVGIFRNIAAGTRHPDYNPTSNWDPLSGVAPGTSKPSNVDSDRLLNGHAIAPKLGNETLKAELGRAAWKLFHTTFARFPDEPTEEESLALLTYVHLFQRLYPCGECATHFGQILSKFPPQVSSRSTAAAWGCHVHNEVNKSLGKNIFDCSKIGDFYDCGCADDEQSVARSRTDVEGADTRAHTVREPASDEMEPVRLVREGCSQLTQQHFADGPKEAEINPSSQYGLAISSAYPSLNVPNLHHQGPTGLTSDHALGPVHNDEYITRKLHPKMLDRSMGELPY